MSRQEHTGDSVPWYRVPVLWVGIAALIGSIVGCGITVALALQHADNGLADVAPGGRFQLPPLEEQEPAEAPQKTLQNE